MVAAGTAHAATARSCTPNVGGTGLSAALVAHGGQTIAHRRIRTSCDIGIYVGAGASQVRIKGVRVSGAHFQGIFVEKTSHVTVENSTIDHNGLHTIDPQAPVQPGNGLHSYVSQSFGVAMFGVSHVIIRNNRLFDNGRGGIGVMDNGPNDPGALTQNTEAPLLGSTYVEIIHNRTRANFGGCAIVVATQNPAGHLARVKIADNIVVGTGMSKKWGPDIGGIVAAANTPNSWLKNVTITGNRVSNSFEGGVIVNAESFNAYTRNVLVADNVIVANNWGAQESPKTAGVIVFANPASSGPPGTQAPQNVNTVAAGNVIAKQYYGIYSVGPDQPNAFANNIRVTPGGTAVHHE